MSTVFSSKFVKMLKSWDERELKSFGVWLQSPWCNTNKSLIRLFEQLKKYYPAFNHRTLTKEKLFQKVLPKGKFSVRRMNNLLSEAYLSAERFLIFQRLVEDQNLQKDLLTRAFQNHHLEDWFFKDIKKEIERLENKPVKDWEDHLALLHLHRRIYHHPNAKPRIQPGNTTIVKMGEQVDLIYLLEKAAIINEKIFRKRILKGENHEIEDELNKWKILSEGVDHPAIEFYKMRFSYTEENRLQKYLELKTAFLEKFEILNEKEQKIHLISLLNDTSLLGKAQVLDITEGLPLYKLGLKTEILLHEGVLHYLMYITIVSASNTKKDFEYTAQFIEQYTTTLDKPVQEDALHWAHAHTAYRKEELNSSIDILLSHEFKAHHFQLVAKLLTTQIYVDLYLQDDSYQFYLFNFFDAFEKWVLREKFRSAIIKKSYLRFIQVSRALVKAYGALNFKAEKLTELLQGESNLQAKNWLHQKVEQIIKLKKK